MRDDNDSGYKSTSANEEIVDGTGSPRTGQLAHKLSTKGFWVGGLDWAGSGLGWCLLAGLGRAWVCRAWSARLGASPGSPEQLLIGGEKGKRRGEEERKERKKRKRGERSGREGEKREEEKKNF